MNISRTAEPTPHPKLRLWPGIVAVALLWLSRFGLKAAVPGIKGFGWAVMGSLFFTLVLLVWWAFFSRASRKERFGGLAHVAPEVVVVVLHAVEGEQRELGQPRNGH